jgi:DNA invertase Pin-like site-specific DNA recombinase
MSGKKIGYLRVSTLLKNEDRRLSGIELDKEFIEEASARDTNRPVLKTMLDFVREGDEVYIHDTSRLARNLSDLQSPVETITGKGPVLKFVKENLTFTSDRNDPMSELLLNLLDSVYTFERQILFERQREGVQIAKQAGKYTGRKKSIDTGEILRTLESGLSMRKTAEKLGISLGSVQRAKQAA